jgi:hypothetical protein
MTIRMPAPPVIIAGIVSLLLSAAAEARAGVTFVTFDVPAAALGTFPSAINTTGEIAGTYLDSGGVSHGFVRRADGTITAFDVPQAFSTTPNGINDKGVIAGFYGLDFRTNAGFVRGRDGTITTFEAPGNSADTIGTAIDATGTVVGVYDNLDTGYGIGFSRSPRGRFKTFSVDADGDTLACCISTDKVIAGTEIRFDQAHGYVRDSTGHITKFDVAGADGTEVYGLSDTGWIAGKYIVLLSRRKFVYRGFARAPDGTITTFDFSDDGSTQPCCVDANGTVAGAYNLRNRPSHGFLRTSDGQVTTFDVPNDAGGTFPVAMNAQDTIAGYFVDGSGLTHGFVRTP